MVTSFAGIIGIVYFVLACKNVNKTYKEKSVFLRIGICIGLFFAGMILAILFLLLLNPNASPESLGENSILFLGFLSRKETIKAFVASDIFVFSSLTDTQGLVLSEAAAASKPIVLLRDPGLTPLASENNNAFLSSKDKGEFAEYVLKLLRDKNLYDRMALNSQDLARKFSIEVQAKKLVEYYEDLIRNHKSSSWRAKVWSKMNKKIDVPFKINGSLKKFKNIFK